MALNLEPVTATPPLDLEPIDAPASGKLNLEPIEPQVKSSTPFSDAALSAGRAAVQTLKGFIPTSVGRAAQMLTPVASIPEEARKTYGLIHDWIKGSPIDETVKKNLPESQLLVEADKTPPFSQQRFEAGFNILTNMGMAAALSRGLIPKGGEVTDASQVTGAEGVSQPDVRTQVGEETPLRQQGETPQTQPQETVAPQVRVSPETGFEFPITEGGESDEVQGSQESGQGQRGKTGPDQEKDEGRVLAPEGGASIRAVSKRPIEAPPPGTIKGWEAATAHGENWLNQGGDINKVVTDFRKSGKVNELEMGKMNAYLNKLQSVTNQAGDALRTRSSDPALRQAYQAAVAQEQAFTEAYKPMHTVASGSLAALQGHVPLTPDAAASFTGLSRRFGEFQGRKMTPEEVVKADKISKNGQKSNGEYARANGEVYKALDNEYGRIKSERKGPPSLERLGKIFGEGLNEVCDL